MLEERFNTKGSQLLRRHVGIVIDCHAGRLLFVNCPSHSKSSGGRASEYLGRTGDTSSGNPKSVALARLGMLKIDSISSGSSSHHQ